MSWVLSHPPTCALPPHTYTQHCLPPPPLLYQINKIFTSNPAEILQLFGTSLANSSNFFLNYVMFRALAGIPLRMLIPHIGIRLYLFRWVAYMTVTASRASASVCMQGG